MTTEVSTTTEAETATAATTAKTAETSADTTITTSATTSTAETTTATDTVESSTPDWRQLIVEARAKGDEAKAQKLMKKLERFTDAGALFDSFEETVAALRADGRIKLPGKDATPEEMASFNKALGVPEKIDGYKIQLPEDIALDDNDKAQLKAITEYMHKQGGMIGAPATVQAAANLFLELREQAQAQLVVAAAEFQKASEAQLKREWQGADYAKNLALTGAGIAALTNVEMAEELRTLRLANGALLGDHPAFVKLGAAAGRALQQDPIFWNASQIGGDAQSLEARKAEIMKLRTSSVPGDRAKYAELAMPGGELNIINERLAQVRNSGRAA